jgi:hypothetical protein
MFGSQDTENVDQKSAFVGKRAALSEISHQSKISKLAAPVGKEAPAVAGLRRVLGDKVTNVPSAVDSKLPKKATTTMTTAQFNAATITEAATMPPAIEKLLAAPAPFQAAPIAETMDTATDIVELGEEDMEDVDKFDFDNPQLVSEYVKDIYTYLRELEVSSCACMVS